MPDRESRARATTMAPALPVESAWRRRLSWVLCGVGLSGIFGYAAGLFPLAPLAQRYNVAPIPAVFSPMNGVESIARRFSARIVAEDGREYRFDDRGAGFARRIDGPYTRRAGYVLAAMFLDQHPERRSTMLFHYAFCTTALPRELGIEGRVRLLEIRNWSVSPYEDYDRTLTVECFR